MALNLLRVEIRYEHDVVLARQRARQVASALKFDTQDQTRIATAVSEIARNAFQYGGGGLVEFRIDKGGDSALTISVGDKGRGIGNLGEILDGKYVSQTGMGLGILGAKRLMDFFHVETAPGKGTTITLRKLLPSKSPSFAKKDLDSLLSTFETRAPHNPYEELQQQNKELLNTLDELRARQAELAQLNQELDETNRGVVALYAELDDKADFLQRASELKSHFLSNMSHEFRTPLNSILALGQILIDRLDGELSAEQEKQVRFIRNSAQNLLDLVNDLLDLAKVEAGKVTIRPSHFSVNAMFAALRGMLRPLLIQNSSVKLVFDDPAEDIEIYSDEAKVSQILRNFISNALKFTERGEVRVSVSQERDDVHFSVTDTGIGIAEEDQERIFQEWTQVEGKLQKIAKGSGLGLPLSRKLALLLGGNVYLKSRLGLGSTFTAVIPAAFKGEVDVVYVPEVKRELDASRLPVLVVEDNREALFIYEKYLKGSRFQVVPARNIEEAKASLKAFRPVAMILDVLLEGEHSWDLLRDLKQDSATRDIPIYVVTVVDNRQKALALGADGFQAKPIDRIWLLDQLNSTAAGKTQPRVLIIDDDETSRYLVRTVLANSGCEMREADGGIEGVRLAKEYEPDIVILDLAMPDLNGFEVLRELNRDPHTSNSRVIVHTSKTLGEQDYSHFGQELEVIPKEVMKSRDKAIAKFTEAFRKAGVGLSLLAKDHSRGVNNHV
jgi:signal transduction histidine kinase/CheY-like chemotaxis protein